MKIFGVGSVLEINEDFVTVKGFSKKCDSDGFYRYYVNFGLANSRNAPDPVDIRDFETCKYNVVSV
jgi:hypothetical protein